MIRVFTLCLVGTATVASADGYGFRTPTGNIYCNGAVTTSEMICSIVERHGPPAQPNTGACPEVWGHHVQLGGTGPARVICAKRPSRSYYSDVAEYGLSASFGNITCRSERTGLQCTNPEGHGFFLSRREQRILSSSTQDWSRPTRSEIREAQELLARLGYDPGVPDGVTGPNTARAVSAFQRDSGAQQTGAITNALITSLQGAVDGLIESGEHATEKSAEGPSFDCARAGTPTERAICASPELARLDRHMAEAFAQAFAGASDPEHVRADQRAWLQTRDGCGAEVICLKDVMSTRIAEWTGHVGTERDQPHNDAIASETLENLARFDRDVYLLRFAESEGGIVHFSPLNFEDLGPEALTGAVEGAIGTRPTFARLRAQPPDLAIGVLMYRAYALVAGDWRNRVTHVLETNYPSVDFEFVQIARATDTGATDNTADPAPTPLATSDFGVDEMPILRAWLPHYLDATSEADQLSVLEQHIVRLQQRRDYSASEIFAEGEIEGRQASFLARSAYPRWRDALEAHSLTPPFEIRVRGTVPNLDYDFERGALVLYSGYDGPRSYHESISHSIFRSGIFQAGGLSQRQDLLGIKPPSARGIGLDREVPTVFPMAAERAERMINDRDIVIYDAALRITDVDYSESQTGHPRLIVDTEVLGVNVTTDAGEQIAAFSAQDMPAIAPPQPEPEETGPIHGTVHLARPSDILASIAVSTGEDAAALIESLYPSTSQDAFDRRDAIADLVAASREIDLGGFWMSGRGRLADYDHDTGEYGLDYVVLTYPDSVSRNERNIRRRDLLRLANVIQGSGVRFAMTESAARELREAMRGSDATFRARLAADEPRGGPSELPLTATIQEIVFVDQESDPSVLDEGAVVTRISLTPPSGRDPVDDSIGSGADGTIGAGRPEPYDILGVSVRKPLAVGLAQARAAFEPQSLLYGRRDNMIEEGISRDATTPLMDSVTMVRNDGQDYLTIFHEPLVQDDPITGVARTMTFPEGARPALDTIMETLIEKYGKIGNDGDDGSIHFWTRTPEAPPLVAQGEMSVGELVGQSTNDQFWRTNMHVCERKLAAQAVSMRSTMSMRIRQERPYFDTGYPLADATGEPAPYPEARPLWPLEVNVLDAKCDAELVFAVIRQDEAGLVSELRVFVTSRAYVPALAEEAKAALRAQSAAEQFVPEIEF